MLSQHSHRLRLEVEMSTHDGKSWIPGEPKSLSHVAALSLFLLLTSFSAKVPAEDSIALDTSSSELVYTSNDVKTRAIQGLSVQRIGRLYDAEFHPLKGSTSVDIVSGEKNINCYDTHRTLSYGKLLTNTDELRANARLWNVISVKHVDLEKSRHLVYRVANQRKACEIDDTFSLPNKIHPKARWYISGVYYGHLVEVMFSSTERKMGSAISTTITERMKGSVSDFAASQQLDFSLETVGLEAVAEGGQNNLVFATSLQELSEFYRETNDPVPIMMRYSGVPLKNIDNSLYDPSARYTVRLENLRCPEKRPNGRSWDKGNGRPDLRIRAMYWSKISKRYVGAFESKLVRNVLEMNSDLLSRAGASYIVGGRIGETLGGIKISVRDLDAIAHDRIATIIIDEPEILEGIKRGVLAVQKSGVQLRLSFKRE